MSRTRTRVGVAMLGAGAMLFASATTGVAITGGTYDSGNTYSNVGMIVFYDQADHLRYRCSATLVSPTILITAAHCTDGTLGMTIVTFDPLVAEQPPSGIPRAPDDTGNGYSLTGYTDKQALTSTGVLSLTYFRGWATASPLYSHFTDLSTWNDVGIVQLTTNVQKKLGITPAKLPPRDFLVPFAQPDLNSTLFRVVGYGTEVGQTVDGPQKPTPMSYPLERRYTDEVGQKLMPQIVQTNGNPEDTRGGGGTCFGDSGGPSFLKGYLVTVTSYGLNGVCRYLGGLQRVDIASVQNWLAGYGLTFG